MEKFQLEQFLYNESNITAQHGIASWQEQEIESSTFTMRLLTRNFRS